MYKCSHCGASLPEPMSKCPNCGVMLLGVKCNYCGYVGSETEFKKNENRCPKCNKDTDFFRDAPGFVRCRKCGKRFDAGDRYCYTCGAIRWVKVLAGVLGSGVVALLYAFVLRLMISDPGASDMAFRIIFGIFGVAVVFWVVIEIIRAFKTIFSKKRLHLARDVRKLEQA